jgi:hypothetical protein
MATKGNSKMKANEFITEAVKQRLDPKCWKGKHKEGTKIKGGVRVNNCVPNESVEETANAAQQSAIAIAKKKKSGVAEGSISDLLNQDPTSPKFNDHPGASQLKKAKGYTPSAGELARDLIKTSDDAFKSKYGMSKKQAEGHYSSSNLKEQGVTEGIMDVVKKAYNDCVVGYPQGTSEGQFLQGWARAIRAETGREISLEKLTKLYHDYSKRSPEIMQSHGTMDEDSYKDTSGTFKDRLVGEILNFYTTHGRIPRVSEYSRAVRSKLNSLDYDERSKLHRQANVKALKLAGKQGYFSKLGLDEGEGMSRAAKGYEKYGREGMQALAKAGREGRALDPVRKRYDRYDESVVEGAEEMPVNKYIAQELDTLLKLAQDQVDDIVNRSRDGYGNKKSGGLEDAIFELSGLSNGFHSSQEEGIAELQELMSGLPRIGNWIMRNLKKVGNRIDLPQLIQSETSKKSGVSETAAWRRKEGKSKTGGLNKKGVASYRRENPGSKLQTAVTTKPSKLKKGSKASKRRKSFCARMGGVKGPMKKPNGKPTRKALALRKWNCESVEQLQSMLMIAESWAREHEGK